MIKYKSIKITEPLITTKSKISKNEMNINKDNVNENSANNEKYCFNLMYSDQVQSEPPNVTFYNEIGEKSRLREKMVVLLNQKQNINRINDNNTKNDFRLEYKILISKKEQKDNFRSKKAIKIFKRIINYLLSFFKNIFELFKSYFVFKKLLTIIYLSLYFHNVIYTSRLYNSTLRKKESNLETYAVINLAVDGFLTIIFIFVVLQKNIEKFKKHKFIPIFSFLIYKIIVFAFWCYFEHFLIPFDKMELPNLVFDKIRNIKTFNSKNNIANLILENYRDFGNEPRNILAINTNKQQILDTLNEMEST